MKLEICVILFAVIVSSFNQVDLMFPKDVAPRFVSNIWHWAWDEMISMTLEIGNGEIKLLFDFLTAAHSSEKNT